MLALWSVGLTYRDVSIYYRNAIYKLQQQHTVCTVCLSVSVCVCVCVVLNEISAENPLDKNEALYLQELLRMRVLMDVCVCIGVYVCVVVQVILSASLSLSLYLFLSFASLWH